MPQAGSHVWTLNLAWRVHGGHSLQAHHRLVRLPKRTRYLPIERNNVFPIYRRPRDPSDFVILIDGALTGWRIEDLGLMYHPSTNKYTAEPSMYVPTKTSGVKSRRVRTWTGRLARTEGCVQADGYRYWVSYHSFYRFKLTGLVERIKHEQRGSDLPAPMTPGKKRMQYGESQHYHHVHALDLRTGRSYSARTRRGGREHYPAHGTCGKLQREMDVCGGSRPFSGVGTQFITQPKCERSARVHSGGEEGARTERDSTEDLHMHAEGGMPGEVGVKRGSLMVAC
ncbi:hypothetical protein ARMSODRAFT_978814 [Armillaria solidipes]|uniref:Uncharacterized protein n=1 Tax=Armillaria solidipes TaxID=1076256 RepID=A0A2H3B592_9AGAR|nr:hypothetical protein ARMSODRAFT_978814 [Armillaria solidipes]